MLVAINLLSLLCFIYIIYMCFRYIIIPRLAGVSYTIMIFFFIGYLIELHYTFINIMYGFVIVNLLLYTLLKLNVKSLQ